MNQYASVASDSRQQARRAALAVHGLAHSDRDWLLAQLPTGDRERLWGLLEELTALGIPGDRGLLEDLLGPAPFTALVPASSGRASAMNSSPALVEATQRVTLSRLDSVVIVKLFNSEPAGLIAHVLNIETWPWQGAVLEKLEPVKRQCVEAFLGNLRREARLNPPTALHKSLMEAICRQAEVITKLPASNEPVPLAATHKTSRLVAKPPAFSPPLKRGRK